MTAVRTSLTLTLLLLVLGGCGQTGDLYWPADEREVVDDEDVDPDKR